MLHTRNVVLPPHINSYNKGPASYPEIDATSVDQSDDPHSEFVKAEENGSHRGKRPARSGATNRRLSTTQAINLSTCDEQPGHNWLTDWPARHALIEPGEKRFYEGKSADNAWFQKNHQRGGTEVVKILQQMTCEKIRVHCKGSEANLHNILSLKHFFDR